MRHARRRYRNRPHLGWNPIPRMGGPLAQPAAPDRSIDSGRTSSGDALDERSRRSRKPAVGASEQRGGRRWSPRVEGPAAQTQRGAIELSLELMLSVGSVRFRVTLAPGRTPRRRGARAGIPLTSQVPDATVCCMTQEAAGRGACLDCPRVVKL